MAGLRRSFQIVRQPIAIPLFRLDAAITLDASIHRQGGKRIVVLIWSSAHGGKVTVSRDHAVLGAADDDGEAQDKLGTRTGTITYQVCETD